MANSAIVAVGQTVLTLVIASLAGYGFARTDFPGRRVAVRAACWPRLAVPEQAVIVPLHTMFAQADLHNTYIALIAPRLAFPFGVLLMTQYFRGIPAEIEEAAMLDSASRFKIFWRIVLPLSIPAQATLGDLHLPARLERVFLAAGLGDEARDVHADGRPGVDADQLRADRRHRLPDGAGGVRRPAGAHPRICSSSAISSPRQRRSRNSRAATRAYGPPGRTPTERRTPCL